MTALDHLRIALGNFNACSVHTLRSQRDLAIAEGSSCGVLFAECAVALENARRALEDARTALHQAQREQAAVVDDEPVTDRAYRARLDTLPSEGECAA